MSSRSLIVRLVPGDGARFDYTLHGEDATVLAEDSADIPFGDVGIIQPLQYALPERGLDADQLMERGKELLDLLVPGELREPFVAAVGACKSATSYAFTLPGLSLLGPGGRRFW